MSIAEIHYSTQGEPVSSTPLDKAIKDAQKLGIARTGNPGVDLLTKVAALPHLVDYRRLSTLQTGTFPARAHFVIAEGLSMVTNAHCRIDDAGDGTLVATGVMETVFQRNAINDNPRLWVGNASYKWTPNPKR